MWELLSVWEMDKFPVKIISKIILVFRKKSVNPIYGKIRAIQCELQAMQPKMNEVPMISCVFSFEVPSLWVHTVRRELLIFSQKSNFWWAPYIFHGIDRISLGCIRRWVTRWSYCETRRWFRLWFPRSSNQFWSKNGTTRWIKYARNGQLRSATEKETDAKNEIPWDNASWG